MTTIQITFAPMNYHPMVFINMMEKLEKLRSITVIRRSPIRIEVITKSRRKLKKISRTISAEAKVLGVHYNVPSRIVNKRYFEFEAYKAEVA